MSDGFDGLVVVLFQTQQLDVGGMNAGFGQQAAMTNPTMTTPATSMQNILQTG